MSSSYNQINLTDILEAYGEEDTKRFLSCFSCPLNKDIQAFLKEKAIAFSQSGLAKTHLVYWQSEDMTETELVGYYSLAPKILSIKKDAVSKTKYKSISKFGVHNPYSNCCDIPSILIGQIGKNFSNGNETLISGTELLGLALEKVKEVQMESGGRYTYLECEDIPELKDFYTDNGFTEFGKRTLDKDETNINGNYLIQFIKKL